MLRTGQLLDARRGLPVLFVQLIPRNAQHADLELWLVDKEAARSRFLACARAN